MSTPSFRLIDFGRAEFEDEARYYSYEWYVNEDLRRSRRELCI